MLSLFLSLLCYFTKRLISATVGYRYLDSCFRNELFWDAGLLYMSVRHALSVILGKTVTVDSVTVITIRMVLSEDNVIVCFVSFCRRSVNRDDMHSSTATLRTEHSPQMLHDSESFVCLKNDKPTSGVHSITFESVAVL